LRDAIDQYYADKNKYPSSLDSLVSEKYLRRCPWTLHLELGYVADDHVRTRAGNLTGESGVFDVKSGSDRNSLDGTPYANW
jgi:general secretion pathway protein G